MSNHQHIIDDTEYQRLARSAAELETLKKEPQALEKKVYIGVIL